MPSLLPVDCAICHHDPPETPYNGQFQGQLLPRLHHISVTVASLVAIGQTTLLLGTRVQRLAPCGGSGNLVIWLAVAIVASLQHAVHHHVLAQLDFVVAPDLVP